MSVPAAGKWKWKPEIMWSETLCCEGQPGDTQLLFPDLQDLLLAASVSPPPVVSPRGRRDSFRPQAGNQTSRRIWTFVPESKTGVSGRTGGLQEKGEGQHVGVSVTRCGFSSGPCGVCVPGVGQSFSVFKLHYLEYITRQKTNMTEATKKNMNSLQS